MESGGIHTYTPVISIRPTRLLFLHSGDNASQIDFDPMFYSCLKLQGSPDADHGSKLPSTQIIHRDIQTIEIEESEHMQVARRLMLIMNVSLDRLYELLAQA